MSDYYRPQRTRNLFDPNSKAQFRISRSKLDLFLNCSRCFYIDRRLGVGQPPGFPFNLNSAVDALLKKEFDYYRERQEPHPLCVDNGIEAIPFKHEKMDEWRDSLRRGVTCEIDGTTLTLTGGVDDVWINPSTQEIIVVDYKATSKNGDVSLDADWQIGYKRQAEVYQYLFRKNGFKVSDTAYFVYCNGRTDLERFDKRLEFEISILPYVGNADWVEEKVKEAFRCLMESKPPEASEDCDFCKYTTALKSALDKA